MNWSWWICHGRIAWQHIFMLTRVCKNIYSTCIFTNLYLTFCSFIGIFWFSLFWKVDLLFFWQLKCRLIKENGAPGEAVCKVIKERKVDHVVMGSRGLGTVSRALVGSVSDYCLHHSSVPVSVVPPPDRFEHHGFANLHWWRPSTKYS